MYRVFFLCQVSWFSGLPSCLFSVGYLLNFKIVRQIPIKGRLFEAFKQGYYFFSELHLG